MHQVGEDVESQQMASEGIRPSSSQLTKYALVLYGPGNIPDVPPPELKVAWSCSALQCYTMIVTLPYSNAGKLEVSPGLATPPIALN